MRGEAADPCDEGKTGCLGQMSMQRGLYGAEATLLRGRVAGERRGKHLDDQGKECLLL